MNCKHSFIDADNNPIYGKEVCRFCGITRYKDGRPDKKTLLSIVKRHLRGIEKAIEQLEKEDLDV